MPEFEYRATGRNGETIAGKRSAPNREALDAILRREQLTPTRIVEKGKEIAIPKPKMAGRFRPRNWPFLPGSSRS